MPSTEEFCPEAEIHEPHETATQEPHEASEEFYNDHRRFIWRQLQDALAFCLPPVLVESCWNVRTTSRPVTKKAAVFAAALGSTSVDPLADAVTAWLDERRADILHALPRWFRPAIRSPTVVTLTEFSNGRSKYVRDVIEDGAPVLLSRRGKVVAAVVPVQEGVFEQEAYVRAAREIRAERLRQDTQPKKSVLAGLTDEEIETIRRAENKVEAATLLGLDIAEDEFPSEWPTGAGQEAGEKSEAE
jgi:prevent-host-death family protein